MSATAQDGHRNQGADGDEAAVALGQTRPFPDIAEQHIVGKVGQLRCDVAHDALCRRLRLGVCVGAPRSWRNIGGVSALAQKQRL